MKFGSAIPGVGILLALSVVLSNEEQIKAKAIVDRNEKLTYLAKANFRYHSS